MGDTSVKTSVYLEVGKKRTLAGAIEWPGWCRAGRDEQSALQALLDYGPRYERAIRAANLHFKVPSSLEDFTVVERVPGNGTSDFGAPDVPPSADSEPVDDADLRRLRTLLSACWEAFDEAVEAAKGKELRKGPRGGGRGVAGIIDHMIGAEGSYLVRLGGKRPDRKGLDETNDQHLAIIIVQQRQAILDALVRAARGEFPAQGPRGGARWSTRFFVRRDAWHILDHAWEIEDKVEQ
jgi:hypothetical protein